MIMVKKEYLKKTEGIIIHLLHMPWREEGHTGQAKLQSSVSLTSGQNSEYISESCIMPGKKSNLSNLWIGYGHTKYPWGNTALTAERHLMLKWPKSTQMFQTQNNNIKSLF